MTLIPTDYQLPESGIYWYKCQHIGIFVVIVVVLMVVVVVVVIAVVAAVVVVILTYGARKKF
jgi:Flp pilus assembly protein TadB